MVSLFDDPYLLSFCEKITDDGAENVLLALGQFFYAVSRFITVFRNECGYDQPLRF